MKRHFISLILTLTTSIAIAQKQNITIDHLTLSNELREQHIYPTTPLNDGESYAVLENNEINIYNYRTGKKDGTLLDLTKIRDCEVEDIYGYEFSDNEQKILLYTNAESIYRYSFVADYYVFDPHYNELKRVCTDGKIRNAIISPDGQMVAFVKDNNIYIKKLRYDSTSAITDDGKINEIVNGAPDWVYEEEFSMIEAMAWSPDSKQLAYLKFDETEVPEYSFPLYKASYPQYDEYAKYPGTYTYKYPKAGEKNSKVSVKVYNIETRKTKTMDTGDATDTYIPRIKWTYTDGQLAIMRMNRRQNTFDLLLANTASTICNCILTDKDKAYIDESVLDNCVFLPDNKHFIYVGEEDGWNHIYLYATNGILQRKLTNGDWDVTRILGFNSQTKTLFYQAARTSPMNRDIYSVTLDGKIEKRLSSGNGTTNATFSIECRYFEKKYSDANTPSTYSICETASGKTLRTINDNSVLKQRLQKNYNYHPKEFFTFKNESDIELNGWIIKPSNFNSGTQYPVVMTQYSGPGSQEVLNEWRIGWEQSLASEGYVVVCVDGRGTGCRGRDFKKCTYQHLGKYESDDQIAVAKYLATLPFVDKSRIGIWGWSFGGFMSSLCLCRSDMFKVGIAVAPVTSWRFYDTIYTERFMRTPEENISGYKEYNPLSLAENLSGRLFMIHGTADDNVHMQNQMEFADALIRAGIQFDMFTYPNKDHNIYGGTTRHHLYTMMLNYIKRNL